MIEYNDQILQRAIPHSAHDELILTTNQLYNSHVIKQSLLRQIFIEIIILIISLYLINTISNSGVWLFLSSLLSIIGASIPCCCMPTYVGWKINIIFQILSIIILLFTLLFTCLSFSIKNGSASSYQSLTISLISTIISLLFISPFIYLSAHMLRRLQISPIYDNNGMYSSADIFAAVPTEAVVSTGLTVTVMTDNDNNNSDNNSQEMKITSRNLAIPHASLLN